MPTGGLGSRRALTAWCRATQVGHRVAMVRVPADATARLPGVVLVLLECVSRLFRSPVLVSTRNAHVVGLAATGDRCSCRLNGPIPADSVDMNAAHPTSTSIPTHRLLDHRCQPDSDVARSRFGQRRLLGDRSRAPSRYDESSCTPQSTPSTAGNDRPAEFLWPPTGDRGWTPRQGHPRTSDAHRRSRSRWAIRLIGGSPERRLISARLLGRNCRSGRVHFVVMVRIGIEPAHDPQQGVVP